MPNYPPRRDGRQPSRPRRPEGVPRLIKRRTWILWGAMLVVGFGILIGRLAYWQFGYGAELQAATAEQHLLDVTIPAARGDIYDSTGTLLATSNVVWNVEANPKELNQMVTDGSLTDADIREISRTISEILGEEYPEEEIYEALSDKESSYVLLARWVDKPQADAIRA